MPALKDQNARPADENAAGWPALCATGRRPSRALSCDIREVDMTDMLAAAGQADHALAPVRSFHVAQQGQLGGRVGVRDLHAWAMGAVPTSAK